MQIPSNLLFSKEHEWTTGKDGNVTVGITSYAIEQLGDIVHIELPEVGEDFQAGDSFGTIESTKTVSDLYMPVAGKVIEINEALLDEPESIQETAFSKGWLVKVESTGESEDLMDAAAYEGFIKED
jgi:glycine cleavage system H protein